VFKKGFRSYNSIDENAFQIQKTETGKNLLKKSVLKRKQATFSGGNVIGAP